MSTAIVIRFVFGLCDCGAVEMYFVLILFRSTLPTKSMRLDILLRASCLGTRRNMSSIPPTCRAHSLLDRHHGEAIHLLRDLQSRNTCALVDLWCDRRQWRGQQHPKWTSGWSEEMSTLMCVWIGRPECSSHVVWVPFWMNNDVVLWFFQL